MNSKSLPQANNIATIAARIAECDFSTGAGRHGTDPDSPWLVRVGKSDWLRYLIVKRIIGNGADAELVILSKSQSGRPLADVDTTAIDCEITLKQLIGCGRDSVRAALEPSYAAA